MRILVVMVLLHVLSLDWGQFSIVNGTNVNTRVIRKAFY